MMAWFKSQDWRDVADAQEDWFNVVINLYNDIDTDGDCYDLPKTFDARHYGRSTSLWMLTHRFLTTLDRVWPGFDADPIIDFYGRLLGFYSPQDDTSISGTYEALRKSLNRLMWLIERLRVAAVVDEKPEDANGKPTHSPTLDAGDMIALMKLNAIHNNSDRTIGRYKKAWKAEIEDASNGRRFRFDLATLRDLGVSYLPEWDEPAK